MMNIFLLFLTTILMIGYYVIYSPSQNLEHLETDKVITVADLRSIAECVIGAQNAAMNSVEYDDPCIAPEHYDVTSKYICTTAAYNVVSCDGQQKPAFNYIVTHSKALDAENHASMLKVIESLYQDKGSFGIYQDSHLITADMSGQRVIATSIADNADLENGQLVYIMQYQIPYMYSYPETPGDENTCPEDTVAVQRYGRWLCIRQNSQSACPLGTELTSDGTCEPITGDDCEAACGLLTCDSDHPCVCYDNGEVQCSQTYVSCSDGFEPVADPETNNFTCVPIGESSETSPCSSQNNSFIYSNPNATLGPTIRIKTVHCPTACMTPAKICNTETGNYEYICLPDASKIGVKSCSPEVDTNQCRESLNKGLFFGFTSNSSAYGIKNNNGDDISVSDLLARGEIPINDNMFHCKKCDNGVNHGESASPFVTVCKP